MFDKYSKIEEKYRKDKSPRKNREMGNVDKVDQKRIMDIVYKFRFNQSIFEVIE